MCDGQRALSEGEGERVGANGEEGHCQGRWLTGNSWRKKDQFSLTSTPKYNFSLANNTISHSIVN